MPNPLLPQGGHPTYALRFYIAPDEILFYNKPICWHVLDEVRPRGDEVIAHCDNPLAAVWLCAILNEWDYQRPHGSGR